MNTEVCQNAKRSKQQEREGPHLRCLALAFLPRRLLVSFHLLHKYTHVPIMETDFTLISKFLKSWCQWSHLKICIKNTVRIQLWF